MRFFGRWVGLVTLVTIWALAGPAVAQGAGPAPGAVILVVDMQRIQKEASAPKGIQQQVRDFEARMQAEAKADEEALKAEETALKQQQTLLSPEAFDERRREFETRVRDEERKWQERQRNVQTSVREAERAVLKALDPILREIMEARGGNLLLERRVILTGSSDLDITEAVISRLNATLPTVAVDLTVAE